MLLVKRQTTREILSRFGFDPDTGHYKGDVFPEEYCNTECEMLTFDPDVFMEGVTPGWPEHSSEKPTGDEPEPEEDGEKQDRYSVPDLDEFHVEPKRRGKRIEVDPEKKESVCTGYAKWFNSQVTRQEYGIVHTHRIEKDSADVVYISIDAVYVDKQSATRKTANRDDTRCVIEKEKRIGHMNIKVEAEQGKYYITSTDTDEAFRELIAVIMNNGLYRKYMIFMTDGEDAIHKKIEEYCGMWKHHFELDWIHLDHKCYDRLSNALCGRKVCDPRGNTEYYKQGPKKGQIRTQDRISQNCLFSRAVSRILWAGNPQEAIAYLESINPKLIKDPVILQKLILYIKRKQDWIPCYALRKKAGLKNSSNGVEGQNDMNVADRQKNNKTSWRPEGSSYLASIKTMLDNGESEDWFVYGKISFTLR